MDSTKDLEFLIYKGRSISDIRDICSKYTEEYSNQFNDLRVYSNMRGLPEEVFKDLELFLLDDDNPVKIEDKATGLDELTGRVCFPIRDCLGKVMGFEGHNPDAHPKYLDANTYGFKPKYSTFYGLELIKQYIIDNKCGKPLFITEGIIDCLILRYLGFNCIALMGSQLNKIVGVIMDNTHGFYVADNDDNITGEKFVKYNIKKHPRYVSFVYKNKKETHVKDTNDAYIIYGEQKLKNEITELTKNIFYKSDVLEVI